MIRISSYNENSPEFLQKAFLQHTLLTSERYIGLIITEGLTRVNTQQQRFAQPTPCDMASNVDMLHGTALNFGYLSFYVLSF